MTDLVDPPAETVTPPRRRRAAPKAAPVVEQKPASSTGGVVGLWSALFTDKAQGKLGGDTGLTLAFVVCFIIGTTLCLVGLFDVPYARQIAFAGPLLATFAYPFWGVRLGAAHKASLRERLADNSYYLGFIFTQVALLVGFLPAAFGVAELSAAQIIRFFGVALGASLIGLIARTVLIQMSYTVDEAADVISGEVSSLAQKVSEQSALVLDHFDRLVERLAASQSRLTSELQTSMSALSATVAGYDQAMKSDAAQLNHEMAKASASAGKASVELDEQQRRLADSVASMGTIVEQLKASLAAEVKNATSAVETTVAAVQQSLDALHGVDGLKDGVAQIGASVGSINLRLGDVSGQVQTASGEIDRAVKDFGSQMQRSASQSLERAGAVATEAEQAVASLEQTLTNFRRELDRLRE